MEFFMLIKFKSFLFLSTLLLISGRGEASFEAEYNKEIKSLPQDAATRLLIARNIGTLIKDQYNKDTKSLANKFDDINNTSAMKAFFEKEIESLPNKVDDIDNRSSSAILSFSPSYSVPKIVCEQQEDLAKILLESKINTDGSTTIIIRQTEPLCGKCRIEFPYESGGNLPSRTANDVMIALHNALANYNITFSGNINLVP